jgi:hypothetical protein
VRVLVRARLRTHVCARETAIAPPPPVAVTKEVVPCVLVPLAQLRLPAGRAPRPAALEAALTFDKRGGGPRELVLLAGEGAVAARFGSADAARVCL